MTENNGLRVSPWLIVWFSGLLLTGIGTVIKLDRRLGRIEANISSMESYRVTIDARLSLIERTALQDRADRKAEARQRKRK